MIKTKRTPLIEQEPSVRRNNFDEVCLGYDLERAKTEAERCLNCKNPQCVKGCPVGVNIPRFVTAIKEGDLDKAAVMLKMDNNLPSICGRVCPQEEQCEKYCIRNKIDEAVCIGGLERFVGDYALSVKSTEKIAKNGKKAAIVGSGPAGLSCAAELARAGFDVTVFEAFHKLGGVLVYGIPEFRLPKKLVASEINKLTELGVTFDKDTVIGKTLFVDELLEEYDAVFLGTGAGLPKFMNIKGENLNGVYSANEYLTRVNLMGAYKHDSDTPINVGDRVVVVGAGNVAMDSARTALRLGGKVTLVYRRSKAEMPCRKAEIHHAEEEGVELMLLTNPVEIMGENGVVNGIKCVKMELGEPDQSGRRSPVEVKGSEFIVPCDQVIMALGTSPNPLIKKSMPELECSNRGTIVIDESGETSVKNVYAGGDAVTGAATVIKAMGAGKIAAKSIIERLVK